MATKGDSDDFVSSPLDRQKARHKDSYFPMSDENTAELRDTDTVLKTLKADFLRIARNRRRKDFSRSEASRSPSPVDVSHNGDQPICQNLKSLPFTQQTWSCGLTKLKHNSIYIRLQTMTNAID